MNAGQLIEKIIELDEEILKLQDEFDGIAEKDRESALAKEIDQIISTVSEDDIVPMKLFRMIEMAVTLDNGPVFLAERMSTKNDEIREQLGYALIEIANEDGLDSIMPAIELAIKKDDLSTLDMPYVLGRIEDPMVSSQLVRFLDNKNVKVVYAAIEACVHIGDPDSIEALKKLVDDKREIPVEDDELGEDEVITVGQMATEAITLIESEEEL
ncbi:MAG: HEAT repeat domain-containing protein [Deltaproteobacteria bacterium]|nr:HEAT repeat domain-containing protein [Deltaproteobacteria bacterium]